MVDSKPPEPRAWEVWLAEVPFADEDCSKPRPVVVLHADDTDCLVTVFEMTSRPPRYRDEFILSDWKQTGLKKQSTVKTARNTTLSYQLLKHKIGDLSARDLAEAERYANAKAGCDIVAAVYGSYDCPQVLILRKYRDTVLARSWYGRLFIKLYYAVSPAVVTRFGKTERFNRFWKKRLDQLIHTLTEKQDG
jgi:mRNA-degrading endonuclease toxin of MazEF toxin-antitoxin module